MNAKPFASWDELIAAFEALGGVADNVALHQEHDRRTLVARDVGKPVRIHVPAALLIDARDIALHDGSLVIKPESQASEAARDFFERYHLFTSWSGGGRDSVEAFVRGVYDLPDRVKEVLTSEFGLDTFIVAPSEDAVFARFIDSRCIAKGDLRVMMPVLELVDHSAQGSAFDTGGPGITLAGETQGPVLAHYSNLDTWRKFCVYGFASPERYAFSEPITATPRSEAETIVVRKAIGETVKRKDGVLVPKVEKTPSGIDISFLALGDRFNPSSPANVFRGAVGHYLGRNADEFFEMLAYRNKLKFLKLLAVAEGVPGHVPELIRTVCRLQLETLTCCWFGNWARVKF